MRHADAGYPEAIARGARARSGPALPRTEAPVNALRAAPPSSPALSRSFSGLDGWFAGTSAVPPGGAAARRSARRLRTGRGGSLRARRRVLAQARGLAFPSREAASPSIASALFAAARQTLDGAPPGCWIALADPIRQRACVVGRGALSGARARSSGEGFFALWSATSLDARLPPFRRRRTAGRRRVGRPVFSRARRRTLRRRSASRERHRRGDPSVGPALRRSSSPAAPRLVPWLRPALRRCRPAGRAS